ncbi:MAG: hypothetical protein ACLVEU_17255 [Bacteroides cellulosilyticus]
MMKNRILLTAALCMSMMAQITAQGYTSLRNPVSRRKFFTGGAVACPVRQMKTD